MQIKQKDLVVSLIGGRTGPESTEFFLSIAGVSQPMIFLDLWSKESGRIGFLELHLCGSEARSLRCSSGLYKLAQLHAADYQVQGLVVSLTGVLCPRREVLEQLEARDASLPLAGLNLQSLQQ